MSKLEAARKKSRAPGLNEHKSIPTSMKLRGEEMDAKAQRIEENELCVGGMRTPRNSINRVPGHKRTGQEIAKILDEYITNFPEVQRDILKAIGAPKEKAK